MDADPLDDGTFRLIAEHSGMVLDVAGASADPGAKIIQWPWHGEANQRFRILSRGISIQAINSGLVLDGRSASFEQGANLLQWPLHGVAISGFASTRWMTVVVAY